MDPKQEHLSGMSKLVKGSGVADSNEVNDVDFKEGVNGPSVACQECV